MSTVIVVAPLLIGSWPAITAAVTAAVSSMGFVALRNAESASVGLTETKNRAEIDVDDSEILADSTGIEQAIVVERDGITAKFTRDARGALKVCVEGAGYSKRQLHDVGEELIGRVTQQYAYHRIVTEMKQRNMTIVHEEVDEDRTVRIRVRNW